MTYYELISELKQCALDEPNIRFVGAKDIYELNSLPNIDYDVFYITPNQHILTEDTIIYSLNLYFISRWDESEENQIDIHSRGIFKLSNILNRFNDRFPDVAIRYNGTYQLFYQKFKDVCAGVFLTIQIELPRLFECEKYETEQNIYGLYVA